MDDELEDKVFYQTYVSHMKILSKFAVGYSSVNAPLAYIYKICRLYVLRPEVFCCGVLLFILFVYFQAMDVWSRGLLARIQGTWNKQKSSQMKMIDSSGGNYQCWEDLKQQSSAFAVLGRRPRMEDRFIVEENINNSTGISLFAVFDGHGGEFAADFAKDILIKNIYNKILETTKLLNSISSQQLSSNGQKVEDFSDYDESPYLKRKSIRKDESNKENDPRVNRRDSLRKTNSVTTNCLSNKSKPVSAKENVADLFTSKLNSLMRNSGVGGGVKDVYLGGNTIKDMADNIPSEPPAFVEAKCYLENGKINFGKLITDEILAADYKLVEAAKKTTNIAGTTALIAIVHDSLLTVANVGDSRGVMCDSRGVAIPLSFDHKPQQVRERKRIHDAGGFIAFKGVWRVAGILATSRALGDYPLKDKNLVIATPDILTFDLNDHKPAFFILASDGLWDTFSNEEACSFIKEHITEADFGAKSLAMQSYIRGSVDNITVLVIVFKNGQYRIGKSSSSSVVNPSTKIASKSSAINPANRSFRINRSNSGRNEK